MATSMANRVSRVQRQESSDCQVLRARHRTGEALASDFSTQKSPSAGVTRTRSQCKTAGPTQVSKDEESSPLPWTQPPLTVALGEGPRELACTHLVVFDVKC